MVKDSAREGTLKKKRKSGAIGEVEKDTDLYKKAVEFEEKEALSRPGHVDAQIYFSTCQEIRKLIADIAEIKQANSPEIPSVKSQISEKMFEIGTKLVLLKKLNRMEKVRLVFPKEQLTSEKQKVDSINLQYQNLLYEANHLTSEYRKCFQFKSKDEHIELVPVEEFLSEAPESLTGKFKKLNEPDEGVKHEMRLARLEWELQQRIQLAETCKTLEEEKRKLESEISERKAKLEKLSPLLAKVIEATKPVQEHLGLLIDKTQMEHKLASLLPNPLYVLYANADAYRQVNDRTMKVDIVGDQEEAVTWKNAEKQASFPEDEEDSDNEENQEVEEVVEVKKRRHRKSNNQVDPLEEKKKKLLQVHPLAVEITVTTQEGPSIRIKFSYCTILAIITVISDVKTPEHVTGNTAREVLTNESILNELVSGDFGLESPNPCTAYHLKKINVKSFKGLVDEQGYVYGWAQKICGIDFLPNETSSQELISQSNVEMVMKTIKRRLKARYDLARQLQDLERNVIPSCPTKITIANLTKWQVSSFQQFCESRHGSDLLLESEIVTANDIFYLATISRGEASLKSFVIIKNNYPKSAPIFSLALSYKGTRTAQNDDNVRDMERAVNVNWTRDPKTPNWLLSAQINSLCVALDIYLETEDPKTFQQNTMYIRSCCARNRRKPFKFRNIGVGVFTQ